MGADNSFAKLVKIVRIQLSLYELAVSTHLVRLCIVSAAPKPLLAYSLTYPALPIGVGAMFDWLYNLSDLGILVLFGVIGACLLGGAPFLREKLLRIQIPTADSEVAGKALGMVFRFAGLVLAFSLVQANGDLRKLETQVGVEAHNLAQMDRLILRYGDTNTNALRTALHDYAKSIVTDEWPELSKAKASGRTAALFRPISRGIIAIEPTAVRQSVLYAELLKKSDEIAGDRKARLVAATKLELPAIFWQAIVGLFAMLFVLAASLECTSGRVRALGAQGFGLALLVALVFIFDEPFKGQTAVSPGPIVTVIAEMEARNE